MRASSLIFAISVSGFAAAAQGLPNTDAKSILPGVWIGEGDNIENPYRFHNVNCANGKLGLAIERPNEETIVHLGGWDTDGQVVSHSIEYQLVLDLSSNVSIGITSESFENTYQIMEISDNRLAYEWRGEFIRRFESFKASKPYSEFHEKLWRLACTFDPELLKQGS